MTVTRLFALLLVASTTLFSTGCFGALLSAPPYTEVLVERGQGFGPNKIAILSVDGVITNIDSSDPFTRSESSVSRLANQLPFIDENPSVDAVILRVNSPGGGVTASDIMYHMIGRYRNANPNVPFYVLMESVAASGGYYVSMHADEIYATPTTITGSIGVIMSLPNADELMDNLGIEMYGITSGARKDSGAFYKPFTREDANYYQEKVDGMYDQFFDIVLENRGPKGISEEDLLELADGSIYLAPEAAEAGLIDGVLYLDDLIEKIEEDHFGGKDARVVVIERSRTFSKDSLYAGPAVQNPAFSTNSQIELNVLDLSGKALESSITEPFNYLWIP